jgi:hypothetical protein
LVRNGLLLKALIAAFTLITCVFFASAAVTQRTISRIDDEVADLKTNSRERMAVDLGFDLAAGEADEALTALLDLNHSYSFSRVRRSSTSSLRASVTICSALSRP